MPYQWLPPTGPETHLHLSPHRSLPRTGFVWFIGITPSRWPLCVCWRSKALLPSGQCGPKFALHLYPYRYKFQT